MGEKLKYMAWGAGIMVFLQLWYVIALRSLGVISGEENQIIGDFLIINVAVHGGLTICVAFMLVIGAVLAWPGICRLASKETKGFLVALPFACLMFFLLASMPNWAMAEETANNDWVTTWSEKADTLAANVIITMIDIEDEDISPLMVKVAIKEIATGTKREITVARDCMSKAAVGDTVTVLKRTGECKKADGDGGIFSCLALHLRYEMVRREITRNK